MKRRLVTRKQLRLDYGIPYTPTHQRRMEKAGTFPSRIAIGQCRVVYDAEEIEAWIEDKVRKRDGTKVTTPN